MSAYYKKIEIEDLEIIQCKVLEFIKARPDIYFRRSTYGSKSSSPTPSSN